MKFSQNAPWWRPDIFQRRRPFLDIRRRVTRAARDYFHAQDFTEVDTSALQISPGLEVHLHAFRTELLGARPGEVQTLYLHTSPEFAMKKLLVAGMTKIYQLAHVFRNAERSSRHHPEFTMLEWYRADAGYKDLMQDCIALVRACAQAANVKTLRAHGMICDPFKEWEILTVPDAFHKFAHIDLLATIDQPDKLRDAARQAGIHTADDDRWDDLFFRVMAAKIEPHLGKDCPTFLTDYPVGMAALARPKPEDPRLAERFELYICGVELANAFGELTDAAEQRRRFEADNALKEKIYSEKYPIDEDFLNALAHGMPPSAGIALGFDRLIMLCCGADDVTEVLWTPVLSTSQD